MSTIKPHHAYAKTSPPRIAGAIPRERLFARLDDFAVRPVTWICGPPGAGKTVLTASYLKARRLPALWFQVDADDGDPATFFYFIGDAVATRVSRAKTRLPVLTPEFLPDLPGFARRFFREMFRQLPASTLLVLDNCQEGGPVLESLLRETCAAVPPDARLIVISRDEPGEPFIRHRANQTMGVLDWGDLKLSHDEATALASVDRPLDKSTVERFRDAAEGWAAGFVLLLEYARRTGAGPNLRLPQDTPQVIFDYFAGELFATLPDAAKNVLLHAAIFPQCDPEAAESLSGDATAGQTLESFYRRGLFTDRRIASTPVYQFHPLFRQFLLSTGRETFAAHERRDICRRAGALMEREREIESAATLYCEAQDWPGLTHLATTNAGMLLGQGRNHTVGSIIGMIPTSYRDGDPWLLFWQGVARIPFSPPEGRAHLDSAHRLFRQQRIPHGRFLACAAALETYFFEWSNFAGADPWIREMEELLVEHPDFLQPEIEAQVLGAGLAVIYREPSHPMLDDWVRRALSILRAGRAVSQLAPLVNFVVQFNLWRGRFRETEDILRELRIALDPSRTPPVALLGLECWTAIHAWMTADYPRAYEFVERALEIGRTNGIVILDALALGQGVYAALGAGDLGRAGRDLTQMEHALHPMRRIDHGFYLHLRFGYRLLQGDLAGARADIEAALAIAEEAGSPFLTALNRVGFALVLMEQGEPEPAQAQLDLAMAVARAVPAQNIVFSVMLLQAGLLLDQSRVAAALVELRSALGIGRSCDYQTTTPFWHPRLMSRLCALALEHGIETEYVSALIRKRGLPAPSSGVEAWPWPIRIYTLGRFALVLDCHATCVPAKAQRRSLELLKALISLGGRDVEANRIADHLWPEADGAAARAALHMALHRLRKLLGREEAITVNDGRLSLNPALCWVDVWMAERVLNETEGTLDKALSGEALKALAERTLRLFQGLFLASEPDTSWILPMRERLRRKFARQLAGVGRRLEAAGRVGEAIDLYKRGLEHDGLAEELYRCLIRACLARGNRAEALDAYRRCRTMLSIVLGMAPSPETEALRRTIDGEGDD